MSSDVQSAVQLQLLNNEVSVATVATIVYDYTLMFPGEVEHIWTKSWTWVTMLYFIVRYAGIFYVLSAVSLFGTTFVPGPVKVSAGLYYSGVWAATAFALASSLLMVLRVHAIWNRSKIILNILLLCYTVNVVTRLVLAAIFDNPDIDTTVATNQMFDYSFCTNMYAQAAQAGIGAYLKFMIAYSIIFDALLLILALVPLAKQSIAMYKATGRWEPNRYMSLIVKEGVAYLLLSLFINIPDAIINLDRSAPIWYFILQIIYTITMYSMFPRFVIGMRELFDKDSRGQLEGIDSAFGISSRSGNVAGRDSSVSGIAFAGVSSHAGEEGREEIQLEAVRGYGSRQSCSA